MSTKRSEPSRTTAVAPERPSAKDLALALARCTADHLLTSDGHPSDAEQRAALEQAIGRTLTPTQARLLASREAGREDVNALAERLSDTEPVTRRRRGGLARADLDRLPLPLWQECAEWLLNAEGHHLTQARHDQEERTTADQSGTDGPPVERLLWRSEREGRPLLVVAVRPGEGSLLDAETVLASLAIARTAYGGDAAAVALVLSPATSTVGARLAARAADATLLAGAEVDALLARLAVEYAEEQARESETTEERATAAARARAAILKALDDLRHATERTTQGSARGKKRGAATSRAAVAEAVATIAPHLRALAQIGLAWDTLLDEWSAAFGAHAERAGALPILREAPGFADLSERAKHLRAVALPALEALAATPTTGELGYTAWRAGLCEVLAMHWQALGVRLSVIEPSAWRDFSRARDAAREAEASRLRTEHTHAAARLQKARADLASRAALDVPEL